MCGICGLISPTAENLTETVTTMCHALTHRGPDDSGIYTNGRIAIGMRRLSIIDMDGGHQPIFNENGRLAIIFNGEIYNYPSLRQALLARGHTFQTQSDTETILHLYEEKGEQTPQQLKGMFAFCIIDRHAQSLFLARDRFGEKPLFYYHHPHHGFAFSSEIQSLLAHPQIPRRLNHEALGYYMRVGLVPAPLTMFRDIHILPPGHWLKWQDGQITLRPYATINY